jgi:hypothetical protein
VAFSSSTPFPQMTTAARHLAPPSVTPSRHRSCHLTPLLPWPSTGYFLPSITQIKIHNCRSFLLQSPPFWRLSSPSPALQKAPLAAQLLHIAPGTLFSLPYLLSSFPNAIVSSTTSTANEPPFRHLPLLGEEQNSLQRSTPVGRRNRRRD